MLRKSHTQFSYCGPSGAFDPKSIPGLAIWYDASTTSSIVKNSSNIISAWHDISGNNHTATATGSYCYYSTATFPQGGVHFTNNPSVTDGLYITGCPTSTSWTTFFVQSWTPAGYYQSMGMRNGDDNFGTLRAEFIAGPGSNGILAGAIGSNSGSYNTVIYSSTDIAAVYSGNYIATFQHHGTMASAILRLNGQQLNSADVTKQSGTTAGALGWTSIGPGGAAYSGNLNGIAECLTYKRALSQAEIYQVETYLKNKWQTSTMPMQTAAICHCEGTNDSVIMKDAMGQYPYTFTGTARLSTDNFRFGTSSILFEGITTSSVTRTRRNLKLYSDDFTLEGWFYPQQLPNTGEFMTMFDMRDANTSAPLSVGITADGELRTFDGTIYRKAGAILMNDWNHFQWSRQSGVNAVGINGIRIQSFVNSFPGYNQAGKLTIGSNADNTIENFVGYIDEFRIINGTSAYTVGQPTYTVPTAPFPDH